MRTQFLQGVDELDIYLLCKGNKKGNIRGHDPIEDAPYIKYKTTRI